MAQPAGACWRAQVLALLSHLHRASALLQASALVYE
jgi:hypothetical protein